MNTEQLIDDEAIKQWGVESQISMMVEECAELMQAFNKYYRGKLDVIRIIEELVDVEIMLNQMKTIFKVNDDKLFDDIKSYKLSNIAKRLNVDYPADEDTNAVIKEMLKK